MYLAVRRPFPWGVLLSYLSLRSIPVVEHLTSDTYTRVLGAGRVKVTFDAERAWLQITTEGRIDREEARRRVAALFDVDFDFAPIESVLGRSRYLAPAIRAVPGVRPLGAWDAFELCVRTILGQQVTVAAARTLMLRWVERCGEITPERVLAADTRQMGIPAKRIESIRSLAQAVLDRRLRFDASWPEIEASLRELPGFGPWTRDYLAIRLGRQSDAFPASDLGLLRVVNADTPKELLQIAERWRPYRAYAATYLWVVGARR
ncbi:MAG: AlkA N-terminal domain-containing protein [Gammaproteobacteria bacterium]|nr:3-methyladenine DNA glycosylase [Gammaproteobacteria bacterium]